MRMATEVSKRRKKRVTVKTKKSSNPLFEKWLEEWKNEAASKGSDMQYCFGKALASLKKYPLPLKTGKDCGVLDFFGNRLCIMLDRKLAEYRKTHPEGADDESDDDVTPMTSSPAACKSSKSEPKKKNSSANSGKGVGGVRKKRQYLPAWRSGPYAILLTLLQESQKPDYPGFLTKPQLQMMAQPLCDTSFKKADPGSFYTAWSSMAGLVKRGLVLRHGNPAKFSLSDTGVDMTRQLRDVGDASPSNPRADAASSVSSEASPDECPTSEAPVMSGDEEEYPNSLKRKTAVANKNRPNSVRTVTSPNKKTCKSPPRQQETADDTLILMPGSFDMILLVDKMETSGTGPNHLLEDATVAELSALGTLFELRHLKVGDFTWVCRDRMTGQELVVPYIVERKRMDDLARSIRDGRFHEQKFRMKQCGLQNLLYLVESHGDNMHTSLPLESLNQATINTQVVDGFTVKTTSSHRDSMRYLSVMTRLLGASYRNKTLVSCHRDNLPRSDIRDDLVSLMTFSEFNNASSKTKALRVQDLFVKQLLQLHGLSVEKAQAVVERYPTPRVLMAAYQAEGSAGEKLLASVRYGSLNRLVGPVISKTVYQFYTGQLLS